jgi:hypothetical protein
MGPLQRVPGTAPTAFSQDLPWLRRRKRISLVKNRMREICSSVVERIAKIRRAYFAQNKPIKTISRELRCRGRSCARRSDRRRPSFAISAAGSRCRGLIGWRDQLDGLLLENEGKSARERLTLIRVFEELRALGYEGSYDAVRRYAKVWRSERGAAPAEAGACPGEGRGTAELCTRRGVPVRRAARPRGIYDNMKTAVETVLIGKDRQFNRRFLQMCGH